MFLSDFRWIADLMILQKNPPQKPIPGHVILFASCGRIFARTAKTFFLHPGDNITVNGHPESVIIYTVLTNRRRRGHHRQK
jgi:pyruvate dehydrogenase complex dehydrogenase (E1) component